MVSINNNKGQLTPKINELDKRLKSFGLSLDKSNLEGILDGINFMYKDTDNLISEIADYGKCEPCGMSEGFIKQEREMDSMKEHLICSGCNKKCDGGKTDRDNSYTFESKKYGAYVFGKNGKRVDEWYCEECKFELLCGDCGSPHELETALYSKPEYEDFYLCFSCEIQREDNEHEEKHNGEPNLDCGGCQGGAERGEVKTEALWK